MVAKSAGVQRGRNVVQIFCAFCIAISPLPKALGGGGPEHCVLIIHPSDADSLRVGHHYKHIRSIPDQNVIYLDAQATDFGSLVDMNLDAILGTMKHRGIDQHVDFLVFAPASTFYVPAAGLVGDACSSVTRFALPSAYGLAFHVDEVPGAPVFWSNEYHSGTDNATAFSSQVGWLSGQVSSDTEAKQYFIASMIGYTGLRGNTADELIELVDRSVASDGTQPTGTFYYMETTDPLRSAPRDPYFDAAVASIVANGGQAEVQEAVLPIGRHDCLGIMTGAASPGIDAADLTLLPGAFCDHLTSYAATFDTASQEKVSRWIAKGACGSLGAVQEPCNYAGKFPHPRMHVFYQQGLCLGEAVFRSLAYYPFQMLMYGDPLSRPFAHLPTVTVLDAPSNPVSGLVTLTPTAFTNHPTASIDSLTLFVDGQPEATIAPGMAFQVDTSSWVDGVHEIRIVAYDDTPVRSQGHWVGVLETAHQNLWAKIGVDSFSGDLSTVFSITVSAGDELAEEVQLLRNGVVIASSSGAGAQFDLAGHAFGPGIVSLQATACFIGGSHVKSDRIELDIAPVNAPTCAPGFPSPIAYDYTRQLDSCEPVLIELPAHSPSGCPLSYSIISHPQQAVVEGSGPIRLLRPDPLATGLDVMTFSVSDTYTTSNVAEITIEYRPYLVADLDHDRDVDGDDLSLLAGCNQGPATDLPIDCLVADIDRDNDVDGDDFGLAQRCLGQTLPSTIAECQR